MLGFLFSGLETEKYDRQYSDIKLVTRVWIFLGMYKRWIVLTTFFLLLSALTNIILPQFLTQGIDKLIEKNSFNVVLIYAGYYLLFGIIYFFSEFGRIYSNINFTAKSVRDIRNFLFARLIGFDQQFFDENRTGRIMSRVSDDTEQLEEFLALSSQFISLMVITLGTFLVLLSISVELTVLGLIVIPVLVVITLFFRSFSKKLTKAWRKSFSTVNSTFQEGISGISVAKGFARINKTQEKFYEINKRNYKIGVRRAIFLSSIFPFIDFFSVVGMYFVLSYGVSNWTTNSISPGSILLFLLYLDRFYFPIIFLTTYYQLFQSGLAATERVVSLMDVEPLIIDEQGESGIEHKNKLQGDIKFKNVDFEYLSGQLVIKNYTLHIKPKERIAIVGHTGAGKTTITALLLRLYDISSGALLIDDKSISDYKIADYRSNLAIVFQEPYLFDNTIIENIRYGKKGSTKEEIEDICKSIHAHTFIQNLPEGYETVIGERGNKLSFGQRQLLAFARALLIDHSILILDEATANVDAYTEYLIQEAIDKILKNRTSIIIAHRLTTVLNSDRIIVMDHGQIIEEGDHNNLLEKNGHYAMLYNTYFKHQSPDWEPEYENQIT